MKKNQEINRQLRNLNDVQLNETMKNKRFYF